MILLLIQVRLKLLPKQPCRVQKGLFWFLADGFQPTKMMKEGYIESFSKILRDEDQLVMPDIFYLGGSANLVDGKVVSIPRDISSADITSAVSQRGKRALHIKERSEIVNYLKSELKSGDVVLVMGSRDETLSDFAADIVVALQAEA